jgi:glycosyltransferase involved in cell wall biosynthesis
LQSIIRKLHHESGVTVLQLPHQSGPTAVRNYGSHKALGGIVFFVDSDIMVQSETIARLVADFIKNSDIAALMGLYDDAPLLQAFCHGFATFFTTLSTCILIKKQKHSGRDAAPSMGKFFVNYKDSMNVGILNHLLRISNWALECRREDIESC